jgi:hypothetical protein
MRIFAVTTGVATVAYRFAIVKMLMWQGIITLSTNPTKLTSANNGGDKRGIIAKLASDSNCHVPCPLHQSHLLVLTPEVTPMNCQFTTLIAIATLVLSPNLVHANGIDGDRHLSVGNIQILNTPTGTVIQTPKIQINTPKSSAGEVVNRTRRRTRTSVIRRTQTVTPSIFNPRINSSNSQTTVTSSTDSGSNSTVRSSTIRSSSNSGNNTQNDSQSVSEQQHSIQCSGNGSVVSQSTSTVNGRTVSSQSRTNCN